MDSCHNKEGKRIKKKTSKKEEVNSEKSPTSDLHASLNRMKHLPFMLASIASLVLLIASLIDSHPVDLGK